MLFSFRFITYPLITIFILYTCHNALAGSDSSMITSENFETQLRLLLHNHPELVLDVLREHSELVLEIAQQGSKQRQHKSLIAQWKKDIIIPKKMHLENRPIRGNPKAPVTIVAFSDFTCLYCSQASKTVQQMLIDYKDNVKYIFKHFPLKGHTISQQAAIYFIAASFQSNEKAWALYDLLFQKRDELLQNGEQTLKQTAKEVGLDMKKLMSDLNKTEVNNILGQDIEDAAQLDINGTPYFIVNNLILRGALPPELFTEAINMALKNTKEVSTSPK